MPTIPTEVVGQLHGALGLMALSHSQLAVRIATLTATGDQWAVDRRMARESMREIRKELDRIDAQFAIIGLHEAKQSEQENAA